MISEIPEARMTVVAPCFCGSCAHKFDENKEAEGKCAIRMLPALAAQ